MDHLRTLARLSAEDQSLARRIDQVLLGMPEVSFAYLFGSRTRGQARLTSDIDLALMPSLQGANLIGWERFKALAPPLMAVAGEGLHLVFLDEATILLAHRVLRDGVLVHEKDIPARVRFFVKVVAAYLDVAPMFEDQVARTKARMQGGGALVDRTTLARRLRALEGLERKLAASAKIPEKEFVEEEGTHDLIERYLHLAVDCLVDIANHILAGRPLKAPESYREAFSLLAREGLIAPELARRLEGWAGFRNVLVHLYLDIDHRRAWQAIQQDLGDLAEFRVAVAALL